MGGTRTGYRVEGTGWRVQGAVISDQWTVDSEQGGSLACGFGGGFAGGARGAALVVAVFPDAEDNGGGEQAEEGVEDDGGPSGEVAVEPAEDAATVDEGEGGFGAVADGAARCR